jgi:uncharacterized protein YjgD (DUF1641 family)
MAKYIEFQHPVALPVEAVQHKLEAAQIRHADALVKTYALLDAAEKRGLLDLLRGAIDAEGLIVDKAAGYANTPEGINTMRNLLVLGKFFGSVDPEILTETTDDLTASVVREARHRPAGIFSLLKRLLSGDALRGFAVTVAALESIGRTARSQAARSGNSQ